MKNITKLIKELGLTNVTVTIVEEPKAKGGASKHKDRRHNSKVFWVWVSE